MQIEITRGLIIFCCGVAGIIISFIAILMFSVARKKTQNKLMKQLDEIYSIEK